MVREAAATRVHPSGPLPHRQGLLQRSSSVMRHPIHGLDHLMQSRQSCVQQ